MPAAEVGAFYEYVHMSATDIERIAACLVDSLRHIPALDRLAAEIDDRLQRLPTALNEYGYDPWGLHRSVIARATLITAIWYRYWFRVEAHGIDRLPTGRMLVISNHAGQLPIDAAMIATAMILEAEPPRIARAMGEYWLPTIPFINVLMVRTGSVVGTRKNCVDLLESEEAVIAFPEGVRGMNKLFSQRYQLQAFGSGFMRLALETNAPIVPVAVVGSEEQGPAIANVKWLARFLHMPAFPITLTWPHLGPLGLVPFPVKYHIYFGEPMRFEGHYNDGDDVIADQVHVVRQQIETMIQAGLDARRRRGRLAGIFC